MFLFEGMMSVTAQRSAKKLHYSFYQKLVFLYILNLSDWLCTQALLSCGRFYEANPLMRPMLSSFAATLLIKGLLPLGLSVLCAVLFKLSGIEETKFGNALLSFGIVAYSLVDLWHIINFLLLFSSF